MLSSDADEEWPDTLRDEEVARKSFGELNRDLLGPPGDGNSIETC
jgi:hypothetical protein